MTTPVHFTPLALADIESLQTYIEASSTEQAERFEINIALTLDDLSAFPKSRERLRHPRLADLSLRRSIIRGFPNHLIVYSYDGQRILIERVFHAAQDWIQDMLNLDL